MRSKLWLCVAGSVLAGLFSTSPAHAATVDVADSFSLGNPGNTALGTLQYGQESVSYGPGGPVGDGGVHGFGLLTPFTQYTYEDSAFQGSSSVHAYAFNDDGYPSIFKNVTNSQVTIGNTIYLAPEELVLHPGGLINNGTIIGNYASVIRLTLSAAGTYVINAYFAPSDTGNVTTTADVVINGVSLTTYSNPIGGSYANPTSTYTVTNYVTPYLAAGSTIDFVVGDGANGQGADGTLLSASIAPVPEPTCFAAAVVAPMLLTRRRKRST